MLDINEHDIKKINVTHINTAFKTDFNKITGFMNGLELVKYKLDDDFLLVINKNNNKYCFKKLNKIISHFSD